MKFGVTVCLLLVTMPAVAQDRWTRLTTSHFEMYTNADEKKAHEAILYFERVRDFFMLASPVRPPAEFPTRIVVFRDAEMMHVYAPSPLAAAFYAPGPVRDSIVMSDPSPPNYPVTIHEYVHLVVKHSGLRLPLWLNEGWAEVYSTLRPEKDGVAVGDLIQRHMAALNRGGWFSLSDLERIDNRSHDYNESARAGIFYAESWALTHMLYLSPDYKSNFPKFVNALNQGRPFEEAVQTAFTKTSDQVFADLQSYLSRKKLYGTVFLTPFEKSGEAPSISSVAPYDANLMLADLHAAANHMPDANRAYRALQTDDPKRPEAFAGAGYVAVQTGDKPAARAEFHKAFSLGTNDPLLCMQLAALDREAKQPAPVVMEELARAIQLRPDFSEAIFQLGIMKVDAREIDAALDLLGRVGTVPPERTGIYRSALAYSHLQKGNIEMARTNAEAARNAAKSPGEVQAADRLMKLIEARAKGPAAALKGERLMRATGTAVGLRCVAPGTDSLSKMGVLIEGKQMLFDLPDADAVEVARLPGSKAEMKCGPLQPYQVTVEYAPASVTNQQSAGIIRRLEF